MKPSLMRNSFNYPKKKGFTLIEIIVVLIILGVLAQIAIPSYFSWVERSKAYEAMAALKTFQNQVEACLQAYGFSVANSSRCLTDIHHAQPAMTNFFFQTDEPATTLDVGIYTIFIFRSNTPNDPCMTGPGVYTCQRPSVCGSGGPNNLRSGFQLCRQTNGSVTIQGVGFYQGIGS